MTENDIAQWFIDNGVPAIAGDEAGYVYDKYGPGGESWVDDAHLQQVLASSLPSYTQRQLSGSEADGGYNTNLNDPAVEMGGYSAPQRDDSNPYGLLGGPGMGYPEMLPVASNSAKGYSGGMQLPARMGGASLPPPLASFMARPSIGNEIPAGQPGADRARTFMADPASVLGPQGYPGAGRDSEQWRDLMNGLNQYQQRQSAYQNYRDALQRNPNDLYLQR